MSDRGVSEGVEAVQVLVKNESVDVKVGDCLLYTSPSPRDA